MKTMRKLFATLFLLCIAGMTTAQDVIVMKDQSTIMSKVLEITSTEIKYKKWNNQDGPTYSIDRSEVLSINYENGEVENFSETKNDHQSNNAPQVQYLNSYMTYKTWSLYLNGRQLSDYEIRKLVDPQNYQLYLNGRKLTKAGFISDVGGGVAILAAVAIRISSEFNTPIASNNGASYISTPSFKALLAFTISGVILGGTGLIMESIGEDNMKKVAETYNKKHGNAYSFNLSPTMMRCEVPQSQGNYGLGLTLNINF